MRRLSALWDGPPWRAAVLGAVLVVLGLLLLGFTEHADRLRAMGEDALGGFVLTGRAAVPGPAANGKLVLAVGAPRVVTPAQDAQFGVAVRAPALLRRVEMFQWQQMGSGAQPGYEMDWVDHPIDSSAFAHPAGHTNPGAFPIGDERFDAPDVQVAGFKLAPALVALLSGPKPFHPSLAHIPANMSATFTAHDGTLVSSTNAVRPEVGDLRISWLQIAPTYLTVFARDDAGTLVPARSPSGKPIAQVMVGRLSLTDVLADAPQPPPFKWARRVLAVLLAWAGAALLLRTAHRRDHLLAFALALVPLAVLAAVYWFNVRMRAFDALVALAVVAAATAAWRWRTASRERS
ncbi:MAG TPA: TMEM43 family protein [Rhodanobacteraceae bacterium]